MKAANIAARKFGSNDPAIDHDDLVAIAALRIFKRDPWTIGTAVKFGREAIGRMISRARYRNNQHANTCRGVHMDPIDRLPRGDRQPLRRSPEGKKREFAREMIQSVGMPLARFGRFGVIYSRSVESKLASVFFDPMESIENATQRRYLLVKADRVTEAICKLANSHYVLLLVPDGKSKTKNAAGVAETERQGSLQEA